MSTPFERCLDMLGDVPGKSLEDKLTNYIGNYMALQLEGQRLRAELDLSQKAVDVLESNARQQAKLLADTGRELDQARGMVERLTAALEDARLQLEYVQEKHGYATGETVLARIRTALSSTDHPGTQPGPYNPEDWCDPSAVPSPDDQRSEP